MKTRRILALSLCITMIMSSFAGCSKDASGSAELTAASSETEVSSEKATDEVNNEEVSITTTLSSDFIEKFKEEDDEDEEVIFDAHDESYLSEESESDVTTVTEIQNYDSLYTHYNLLSESWDGAQKSHIKKDLKIYIDNDKIYLINTNPDENVGTNDGYTWGIYDINTKKYTKVFNAEEPAFKANSNLYVTIYNSWYYKNYFYVVYRCSSYEVNNNFSYDSVIKMDVNGNVVEELWFDKIYSRGFIDGSIILECHDKDDYESTFYFVYSSDLELRVALGRPFAPLAHGLSKPVYVSNFFGYDGNIYATADERHYWMNTADYEWKDTNLISEPTSGFGKYSINTSDNCIIDVETGEKIFEGFLAPDYSNDYFGNTYFGGDYNIILKNGVWYKVRYPNGGNIDYSKCETMGMESAHYDDIVQLNETYYILIDDYGIFLRTYEKGETQEETILLYK